jgi:hypothetical protein
MLWLREYADITKLALIVLREWIAGVWEKNHWQSMMKFFWKCQVIKQMN